MAARVDALLLAATWLLVLVPQAAIASYALVDAPMLPPSLSMVPQTMTQLHGRSTPSGADGVLLFYKTQWEDVELRYRALDFPIATQAMKMIPSKSIRFAPFHGWLQAFIPQAGVDISFSTKRLKDPHSYRIVTPGVYFVDSIHHQGPVPVQGMDPRPLSVVTDTGYQQTHPQDAFSNLHTMDRIPDLT